MTLDRRIEVPSPVCLFVCFFNKNEEKQTGFADGLIELANRGFGLSTDAFLKSVKKLLDKEVRTIYHLTAARVPKPYPSHLLCQEPLLVMFYFSLVPRRSRLGQSWTLP